MNFYSLPCPYCGSLVTTKLHCTRCPSSWENEEEFLLQGMVHILTRAEEIVAAAGICQEYRDAMALEARFDERKKRLETWS